ncbi:MULTISPECIES: helix-turn-helix transcriptional regulator [Oceanobacillus]|uniref:helix-turn-helix domain-containing protein n=1 Tax=Oceanobacillus TaxID=182709 RepID=UPI00034C4657|nr:MULTISPECIES: helix-turn-helix transcriptional regulator [Oceanobacillus]MBT2653271.1 helix-turn-helix domain-containing protein [Oceanobacillus sp. ISL-73]MCT1577892.1 helix-turn-helix domain-containing protein [Oceanobacillus kimchii]MCT2136880.1 helix-turn-helix domain-containing protein [Oceanobacillus kimchii]OEH53970.1 transcriptional repressor [Oceanobacillus sp. E9]
MDIGDRIIQLREAKRWSQKELAKIAQINVSVMNRIEAGDRPIRGEELSRFASIFEVSTDFLLGRTNEIKQNTSDEKQYFIEKIQEDFPEADLMFNDLASFSSKDLQDVYDYIRFKKSQKENNA